MKESKNIYESLNDMDFSIEDYEIHELNELEKKKLKNSFKKNRKKYFNFKKVCGIAIAVSLTIGVLSQTHFGEKVCAAAQSKVSEISYSIGKVLNIEKNIESYVKVIGETKEDKGIEVKLDEVIIDKDRIVFNTIYNTTKPVNGAYFKNVDFFINGKKIDHFSSSIKSGSLDENDTLFYSLNTYKVEGIHEMEDIEIKLVLKDLEYYIEENGKEEIEEIKKSKWDFEFTANGKELALETKSLSIDYTFNIENTDNHIFKLKELEYNPIRQTIIGEHEIIGEHTNTYFIQLRGYDNLNNKIIFFIKSAGAAGLVFEYERNYAFLEDWSDEITYITLAPFVEDGSPKGKQVGKEFTIYLNE